jgi:hypothetical protein
MTSVSPLALACACITLSFSTACGSITSQQPSGRIASLARAATPPERAFDVMSSADVASVGALTAYEALARLRPELVGGMPTVYGSGPRMPVLYVNGVRDGHIDLLATIPAKLISEMRYYRPSEARIRFGIRDDFGVLAVRTRR